MAALVPGAEKPFIHPNTPPRLKAAFKRASYNFHALAQARSVNVYHVHRLIHYGIEPANPNIRKMLFLPKRRRTEDGGQIGRRSPVLRPAIKWWRYTLDKQARNTIVERLYQHARKINNS